MSIQLVVVVVFAVARVSSLPHAPRIIGGVDTTIEKYPHQVKYYAVHFGDTDLKVFGSFAPS